MSATEVYSEVLQCSGQRKTNNNKERQGLKCDESETGEGLGIPNSSVRSRDLDNEKTERKKVHAFEMWCWRRVMRVSWMERKLMYECLKTSNQNRHGNHD